MAGKMKFGQFALLIVVVCLMVDDSTAWFWRRRRCSKRNCAMTNWGSWSACSSSRSLRYRSVSSGPSCGGSACGATSMSKHCCLPVHCGQSPWGSWSVCSNRRSFRQRHIVVNPSCGGRACGTARVSKSCCSPVNCVMSSWGSWSTCANGLSFRSRSIAVNPSCGGKGCDVSKMSKTCCLPVNCIWGNWGSWDSCPLHGGSQRRTRTKSRKEVCGGTCSGSSEATKTCSCTRVNCLWASWGAWSTCSSGNQGRTRTKSQTESCMGTCSGAATETRACIGNGMCGIRKVSTLTLSIGLAFGFGPPIVQVIVGGREVKPPGKWPWMVSLQRKSDGRHYCGGTLISNKWVVTAGHCILAGLLPSQIEVVTGGHDLSNPDSNIQIRGVSRLINNPNYQVKYSPEFQVANDIGLVELDSPVTFSNRVQPLCLADTRSGVSDCHAVGWGYQNSTWHGLGTKLQEVMASIVSTTACENELGSWTTNGNIYCVDPTASAAICRGDSGGPMVCKAAGADQYALVGVASFSKQGCTLTPGINGGFTDVAKYVTWIRQQCGDCA